jgi:hypothetical protein
MSVRELRLGPAIPEARRINLRDLGFVGRVSDKADLKGRLQRIRDAESARLDDAL